jgi:hypothetical protein
LRVYVELFVRKVKQRAEKGPEQTRTSFKKKREERTALEPFPRYREIYTLALAKPSA